MHFDVRLALDLRHVQPGPGGADVVAAVGGEELGHAGPSAVVKAVLTALGMNGGRGQAKGGPYVHALKSADHQFARGVPSVVREGLRDVRSGVGVHPAHRRAERFKHALQTKNSDN